jgi:DNA-binding winged helix-turn-helix (wHTH) protein/tetratricopeptide (TPR) repeat protein
MAQETSGITFGPYRLDAAEARLWKGDRPVPLQPRPLAVLSYLAARPGAVVGRDELIAQLWTDTHVTKAVLKVAVRAIREALDDAADAPRYIETVGRDGYRFIGAGTMPPPAIPSAPATVASAAIVGRESPLAKLHAGLMRASAGERAIVFVTGEAGIGKTTVLDRFLEEVATAGDVCIARGQCLEQYGEGEAYLPVLEALGALARQSRGGALRDTLARHAPTWVSQLPALDPDPPAQTRRDGAVAPMPARMLREMADALEMFTRERTLLLVLEDLQWADPSTVDLIASLARRRQPARLLVLGSLRPLERTSAQPLRAVLHDLLAKGLCEEIAVGALSRDDIASYVGARFGGAPPSALRRLAKRVHERTEGNALFMVNMINDLVAAGLLAWRDGRWQVEGSVETAADRIPAGLQELIGRGMLGLPPPVRQVLEAASVAGDEFAVAAVAAALQTDAAAIEEVCAELAAQGTLLVDAGVAEWPDASVSGRYRFRHALYRRVLYEGIPAARRVQLHRAIGEREEAGFGGRAGAHAAELAMHFGCGRDYPRALHFHELAAAAALDRHAAHEAVLHYGAAAEALANLPATPAHASRELELVVARATLLMAIQGYAAPETEQAFARARALCDALPPSPALYPVLRGLISYHQVRAELGEAHGLGDQLLRHAAERPDDATLRVQAHYAQGVTAFHRGALADARTHFEAALRDYDPAAHRQHILAYGSYDPGVACSIWMAWTGILQGELEEAEVRDREGLALAEVHGDVFSLAWAHYAQSVSRQLVGDWPASGRAAAEAARLAEEHGFPYVLGMATVNRGWVMIMLGDLHVGIATLRDGVAQVDRTGTALVRPLYLGMLGASHIIEGDRATGLARLDEGLAEIERTGERVHECALLMAKANVLSAGEGTGRAARGGPATIEDCLRRALAVADELGAHLLALRAALRLAAYCRERGRAGEARTVLSAAHQWFADRPASVPEIAAARQLLADMEP